ncbi:DUF4268 domain-containing protein [Nocardioides sp. NPDC006273]|uniref:DUF4268 domain-containing protein n=1 Tax=Nocardioides sp. NPDC006273 TaxID=3155598 RepID=UPI0033BB3556
MSRLRVIPVREVWKHEAYDFTQWMLQNADVLADVLGMELELTAAEHPVGGFSLDLIGREVGTGNVVIVENQLEQTDHGHLGQIMTYAGGTDPQTIVWCAPSFRDEHRAALDWLNERTDENTRFFGVEITAVQIDDSRPAPHFKLVAQPNDWTKQVHAETSAIPTTEREVAYQEFWAEMLRRIRQQHPDWTRSVKAPKASWMTMPYGSSIAWYSFVFTRTGPRVELYFGSSDAEESRLAFERVAANREQIDADFGAPVSYDPLPTKKACRLYVDRPDGGDVTEEATHEALMDWFLSTMDRFRMATQRARLAGESRGK